MNKVVAIIQARMSSRRFPGKVLMEVAGKPMLHHVIARARRSGTCDQVIVATSGDAQDDAVLAFCNAEGVPCFRGSLDDVLDRYLRAATLFRADVVVRLTGDCPLLDPNVIAGAVDTFHQGNFNYVSNAIKRTYPDGLDTEVLSFAALQRVAAKATFPEEREHVTCYIHRHPEEFRIGHITQAQDLSALRWVVDTPDDLDRVRATYARFDTPLFGMDAILSLPDSHPILSSRPLPYATATHHA